jgi:hypothetical protein
VLVIPLVTHRGPEFLREQRGAHQEVDDVIDRQVSGGDAAADKPFAAGLGQQPCQVLQGAR